MMFKATTMHFSSAQQQKQTDVKLCIEANKQREQCHNLCHTTKSYNSSVSKK